jgi:hypothetical protein
VLADKAYSHPSTRAALRRRQIAFTSPERVCQQDLVELLLAHIRSRIDEF